MNAIEIGKRIKSRREELKLTQEQIGENLGLNKSTIQRYETGQVKKIKTPILQSIARELDVHPSWLALKTDEKTEYPSTSRRFPSPNATEDYITLPVIGEIAAGYENIVLEDWSGDTVDIPITYFKGRRPTDFFVLGVKGNSMFPEYQEGDKVLILKQSTLDYSGQVGAILYNDDNATLKKVEYKDGEDWIKLVPINPSFETQKITGEDLEHCRVMGVPKMLIRDIEE